MFFNKRFSDGNIKPGYFSKRELKDINKRELAFEKGEVENLDLWNKDKGS